MRTRAADSSLSDAAVVELRAGETHLAYLAMRELRPGIGTQEDFVSRVDDVQRRDGYRLLAAFESDQEYAAAVAGWRVIRTLAWGDCIYCDDLSTRPEFRGRGHAGRLLRFMIAEARRRNHQFHLDSGVGPERTTAHRLYLNTGLRISSHHFSLES